MRPPAGSIAERMVELTLLGGFDLVVRGRSLSVGHSGRRLLGLLATTRFPLTRSQVAGTLWPDVVAGRANANLRSVVWRIQRSCPEVLHTSFSSVRLGPLVVVDAHLWAMVARRLVNFADDMDRAELGDALRYGVPPELLPEFDDEEWLSSERERHRQLSLHALEALSGRLVRSGWYGAAVETALNAIRVDPFRESARRAVVYAYLAEGNVRDAHRQYHDYRRLLRAELGIRPSVRFDRLVDGITPVPDLVG